MVEETHKKRKTEIMVDFMMRCDCKGRERKARRRVKKMQYKQIWRSGFQADGGVVSEGKIEESHRWRRR